MASSKTGEPVQMSEKRVQRPFTEAETATLRELFDAGMSDIRIAHAMGRSRPSIASRRAYLGLHRDAHLAGRPSRVRGNPTKRWTQAEEDRLVQLVSDGMNDHRIAELLEHVVSSVGHRRRKLGLQAVVPPGRPRSVDRSRIEEARARIASGVRVADVAAEIGMNPSSLYVRLRLDHAPNP